MTETVGTESGGDAHASDGPRERHKGRGLRVERIYTTEGTHPYDEVTWDRRDVVMTNWRDGSVNFEQRGVEFPDFWSINAANIVTTKYFRGAVGTPQREWSLRQLVDRVVKTYRVAGERHGYFATPADAEVFEHELTWMLLHQVFSFNSPVWFNVGTSAPQQVSACFILSVDDTMESILNWYREEGLIFKGGSGAGLNLSRIRSSKELLSSGGTASGPVSFMRGADASAGTIKSGGATRRAAKMVVLDVDHPDVAEFIETKAREEDKIRALRDAGFDMDLSGKDIVSVQYQNANNSVRVSDEFMRAVEEGTEFGLRARLTGELVETVDARSLFHSMAQAAWECADPGIQYDDTINDWHTNPETGRITASNPCFPADQRVTTDKGLIRIGDLVARAAAGETFDVYTDDVTNPDSPVSRIVASRPVGYLVTGTNEILELRFSDGSRLRCTPRHRLWTANRGWVHADELGPDDQVVRSLHHAARPFADELFPARALRSARAASGRPLAHPPEKWTAEFGHYLGWLVADGCRTDQGAITGYGGDWEREQVLPRHRELLARITGSDREPGVQANGAHQLRTDRKSFAGLLGGLGVSRGGPAETVVPEAVFEAPEDALHAFLRGLYDADGCVLDQQATGTRYVGLGSRSEELLLGVQELLASLGIGASLHSQTGTDGTAASHGGDGRWYDLRISGRHVRRFAEVVGFDHRDKAEKLAVLVSSFSPHSVDEKDETVRLTSRVSRGFETTFNLTEPRNHSYLVGGTVVANCSEYLSLDNSSCNLASMNLMKFLREDGTFDAERFVKAVELVITAMDISICFADFPTEKIGETTRAYRQLGIGYANLGALLMATAHAYDSEGGRALAAAITSLMTGTAYRRSAELAGIVGPYDGYARNAAAHTRVMGKHAAASEAIQPVGSDDARIRALANEQWQECLRIGEHNGWRNAQASVLAPTGCLTADTLVTTDRGLTRLGDLGAEYGDRWQDLDLAVSTDTGPRQADKFFVNGEEPTRRIRTAAGYRIQGTLTHRIKVVDPATGEWVWKRMADVVPGDLVPVQLGTLVGEPRQVPLPVLDQAYYSGDRTLYVPDTVDPALAELVGHFMADGSLHADGIRFCVASEDVDVVERLRVLGKGLFGIEPVVTERQTHQQGCQQSHQQDCQQVTFRSVRLARWWQAAGLARSLPRTEPVGPAWTPRIPVAILETNDPRVYAGFLRGLFEADGLVADGVPSVSTPSPTFADEVRTLLLVLGLATTTRETDGGHGGTVWQVQIRDRQHAVAFDQTVGFTAAGTNGQVAVTPVQPGNGDPIHLPGPTWDALVPSGHELRRPVVQSLRQTGGVPRTLAERIQAESPDDRLGHALGFLFEVVEANEDGGVRPTFDLSVPDNVTYVANGFVSHNTIGLMMGCDTTGVEPDLALVKFKKLVGGGSMQFVNQTVPQALRYLGYQQEQIEAIVEHIAEHGHVVGAPGLQERHYEVFDCAMGERSIAPMGHVRMMAAVQPFISGGISKCVIGNTLVASGNGLVRIADLHHGEDEDTFREERIEIASLDGFRKTDAFYYGGVRPVRRVRLRSGHSITGTYPHRLLTAGPDGLIWKSLGEITEGDAVAVQYGAELWSTVPASLRHVRVSAPHGNQKRIVLPEEMSEELAFLLGAYASEGHTTRGTWTVTITNSVPGVLDRVRSAWQTVFGLEARIDRQPDRCPGVVVSSKTVVEFLEALGCGSRAANKRIPDAVLRSPRSMVLAFLQGLALDAYVTTSTAAKWAICLDSPGLLDDLQSVLTNLGVRHGRVRKHDRKYDKYFDEVYAPGRQGQLMASLVPFLEPDKAARAAELLNMTIPSGTADVVPGITGRDLYEEIPVVDGNLHFSPVVEVCDAGSAPVYDLSVPETHAFVANGIMNHNTVNLPESATVDDIKQIYFESWKLGVKALAVYRDNCKVGQPLSSGTGEKGKEAAQEPAQDRAAAETIAAAAATVSVGQGEARAVRKRLPKQRPSITTRFAVGGAEGYMTASSYPDDGLGEVFLKMSKQGSTLAGVMDAFSIAISIGLQYGVPLETWVRKFVNMRFDPAGMTDDPDIRIASSVLDYIFRRLALDFLPYDVRAELGIFTASERAAEVAGSYGDSGQEGEDVDVESMRTSAPLERASTRAKGPGTVVAPGAPAAAGPAGGTEERAARTVTPSVGSSMELLEAKQGRSADAPLCFTCGTKMRPAGSCYVCEGCGSTSGCS